jgi:hypothetical protein
MKRTWRERKNTDPTQPLTRPSNQGAVLRDGRRRAVDHLPNPAGLRKQRGDVARSFDTRGYFIRPSRRCDARGKHELMEPVLQETEGIAIAQLDSAEGYRLVRSSESAASTHGYDRSGWGREQRRRRRQHRPHTNRARVSNSKAPCAYTVIDESMMEHYFDRAGAKGASAYVRQVRVASGGDPYPEVAEVTTLGSVLSKVQSSSRT